MGAEHNIGQTTLILDAEVAGIEQGKFGAAIFVDVKLLTKCSPHSLLRASAGFCFHEDNDRTGLDDFLAMCRVGSCFRVKAHDFSVDEDCRLYLSSPELTPLDAFDSLLLEQQLRGHELTSWTRNNEAWPDRLLPAALMPLLKTIIGIACGKLLSDVFTRDVRDYLLADSRHWYSTRLEGQIGQVPALIDRALASMISMLGTDRRLRELLIHVSAPIDVDLACLVGVNERLRTLVGEKTRIFVSTTLSPEETCNIGLLGRA